MELCYELKYFCFKLTSLKCHEKGSDISIFLVRMLSFFYINHVRNQTKINSFEHSKWNSLLEYYNMETHFFQKSSKLNFDLC